MVTITFGHFLTAEDPEHSVFIQTEQIIKDAMKVTDKS